MHGGISVPCSVPVLIFFSFLPVPAVPQVIGIDMKSDAPPYKVYDTVESYSDGRQRLNMLTYTGVSGLVTCS